MKRNEFAPNSGTYGSIRIGYIDDEDDIDEGIKKLIKYNRIGIEGNEMWAYENDRLALQYRDE